MRRSGRTAHGALAAAVLATALLSGCTSQGTGVITQAIDPTSASVTSVSTTAPAGESSSNPPTLDSTATSTESSAVVDGTSSVPDWPADFTPAQQQAAALSLQVVAGYLEVVAQADTAPSAKDWTADVRKYAGDPAATVTLASIESLVTANVHLTVPATIEDLVVVSADDHRVVVEACVDDTHTVGVNAAGESVLKPPANPRAIAVYTLGLFAPADGGWLVIRTAGADPVRPC